MMSFSQIVTPKSDGFQNSSRVSRPHPAEVGAVLSVCATCPAFVGSPQSLSLQAAEAGLSYWLICLFHSFQPWFFSISSSRFQPGFPEVFWKGSLERMEMKGTLRALEKLLQLATLQQLQLA